MVHMMDGKHMLFYYLLVLILDFSLSVVFFIAGYDYQYFPSIPIQHNVIMEIYLFDCFILFFLLFLLTQNDFFYD